MHALLALLCLLAVDAPLPDDVVPRRYAATLHVDPAAPDFKGSIQIEIDLRAARTAIRLNAKGLSAITASVQLGSRSYPAQATLTGDEFLTLDLQQPVGPGRATLTIAYTAQLPETPTLGAFRTKFEDRWYAFTTFTAIEARRAFPCFDEPRFKTPWQLTLNIPQADRAFSNAEQIGETPQPDGTKTVRFAPTAALASEVVAFAVGPFDVFDGGTAGAKHVPVRVVTPAGHAAEGAVPANMTDAIMTGLEQYTGIPYPWTKLDDVALPQGAFGGVEQPGMITYRMHSLLLAPDPQRLRGLLTHELAHQWFGNLVTQATWQDVWLSEGFATWLTFHMTDPGRLNAIAARERIMTADAGPKTRPVRAEFHDRTEMKDIYSQFVYQKGGAILLMLEGWLGEDVFRGDLRAYLKAHRGGSATTDDLGQALNATSILHNFLDRTGVPVVHSAIHCETGKPALSIDVSAGPIPVCWRGDGISRHCAVLETGRHDEPLDRCPAWIFPNAGGTGYYRSQFDRANLLNHLDQLTPAERLTYDNDRKAQENKSTAPAQ